LIVVLSIVAGVLAIVLTVSIVFAVTAGAGTPAPVPSGTSTGTASPTATATQTPSATATPPSSPPPLESLVFTDHSLGDIALGVDPAESDAAGSVVKLITLECDGESRTGWVPNYGVEDRFAFGVAVREGMGLTAVQVRDERILTDRGVGVGDSLATMLGAYPEARPLTVNGYMHRYGFDTAYGAWSFDVWMGDDQMDEEVRAVMISGGQRADDLGRPIYHGLGFSCL
jgi:hypothetical protein